MAIQVSCTHQAQQRRSEFRKDTVLIGRPNGVELPDLDLSPDIYVSRQHAVLEVRFGACWLRDAGSKFGTKVNGREVRDQGECRLEPTDTVVVGETSFQVEVAPETSMGRFTPPPPPVAPAPEFKILQVMDTDGNPVALGGAPHPRLEERLQFLFDLPLQFCEPTQLDALLQLIMKRVVEVMPVARRGALLLKDSDNETLLLKAFVSTDEPAVSETLARQAMKDGRGFIWRQDASQDLSLSVRHHHIVTGMYAPLWWHDRSLGVICVDSPEPGATFTQDDLRLLIAVGQYAALTLANHRLQADLQRNAKVLERLLTNFSPKLRGVLVEQARHGRLRPGGNRSEVTVLFCDLCGFTKRAAAMDTSDVVDMLNDYFPALAEAIFRFDGTIDKFVGDAVLAVFGSPEPDPRQHEKAVRAALAMQVAMHQINQERVDRKEPICEVSIGIHCGEVLHGFVGALERLEYTVIGDAVNRTARYCDGAQAGEVFISPAVFQRVFNVVQAEKTTFQSKEGEMTAFRVRSIRA